jgi:hypothetical protein
MGLEVAIAWLRSNADLALMAFALGAGSLTYAAGAFVMALALHPPNQHGWSGAEMISVGVYPLGWIGLMWGTAELWNRWRRARRTGRHAHYLPTPILAAGAGARWAA